MTKKQTSMLVWLCASAALLIAPSYANAQNTSKASQADITKSTPTAKSTAKTGRPYYIEFRSRSALSYGHTFAVIARVGQKLTPDNVVGLHPFTESSLPWMLGHLIAVPSETGFSDGDIEDEYITARYRVMLTTAEHQKLMADVAKLKAGSPLWHAAVYNCNAFVADVAKSLGLKAPSNIWQYPKEFITELKQMNNGIKQLPPHSVAAAPATAPAAQYTQSTPQ